MHINFDSHELHGSITNIWQCIHELEEELALQKQLARLKEQIYQELQAYNDHTASMLHWRLSSFFEKISVQKWQQSAAFMLQSSDLQLYYSRITWEHWNWFCDAKDVIEVSIPYFLDDIAKVQYALCYITTKSKTAWRKYSKIIPKNNWIWVGFEQFLLNHIKDSQNWHLAISKHYTKARQKPEQKTSDFINYLVSLEHNFEKLSENMCCDNLLNKMQKGLYDKIVVN